MGSRTGYAFRGRGVREVFVAFDHRAMRVRRAAPSKSHGSLSPRTAKRVRHAVASHWPRRGRSPEKSTRERRDTTRTSPELVAVVAPWCRSRAVTDPLRWFAELIIVINRFRTPPHPLRPEHKNPPPTTTKRAALAPPPWTRPLACPPYSRMPRCTGMRCAGTCHRRTSRYASTAPNSSTTTTPTTRSYRYKRARTADSCEFPGQKQRVQKILSRLSLVAYRISSASVFLWISIIILHNLQSSRLRL